MSNAATIRCVIVDDEPLAVGLLAQYVEKTPGLVVVFKTTHVLEALSVIEQGEADLLFLDIHMPELSGMQFMKLIGNRCKVVLTTAYPQYALEGYEHDVVDYLLKPFSFDRYMMAVMKARERLDHKAGAAEKDQPDHLFIKAEYRIQKVNLDAIFYIEALRDYVAFHTPGSKILSLESMKKMEATLPPATFIRIHKSYIINRNKIEFLDRGKVIINGQYLPVGDTYRDRFMALLGIG
ncbi:LytR/AlgR family response regulator transcription factor [Paraflavitalea pollutisoli]|uniref:LytR/AlgR family response regulator transcription factor n=1 Tax=Paraflavitalea pollutisoli TaxID=3034143 RepID=UPI0023EB7C1E|nr:LytTR family DNA-binding domain-containing protein [Paraflavitalea sp. H1-2-19X]